MHLKFFANSYEYVKKAVIHAIAPGKEWVGHPMLFQVNVDRGPRVEGQRGGVLGNDEPAAFLRLPEEVVLPGKATTKQDLVRDLGEHPNRHAFLDPDATARGLL